MFTPSHFHDIILKIGDPDGRYCILIAKKDNDTHLFCGLYAPNKHQDRFFTKLLKLINDLIIEHNVTYTTIGGDFNVELTYNAGRHVNACQKRAKKSILDGFKEMDLTIVSDTSTHTWGTKLSRSTIDYIATNITGIWDSRNVWGIDKSDHAFIEANCHVESARGPGLPRIDPTFLENDEVKEAFLYNFKCVWDTVQDNWDPHTKLEFMKTCLRSEAFRAQSLLKKDTNAKLDEIREKLQKLESDRSSDPSNPSLNVLHDELQIELDIALESHSKRLAQRKVKEATNTSST
jgi:hypothetical protein